MAATDPPADVDRRGQRHPRGAALTVPGLSAAQNAPGAAGRADEPIVVHLRDAGSGTMDVFVGETRIEVRDRGLADRLRRAARR